MAFPYLWDADTQSGTVTSNSASWTLTYPTNLVADDLILAYVSTDGNTATTPQTWPATWVHVENHSGGAVTRSIAKKKSLGTETGTFSLGLSASEQGAWRIFRISQWEGTLGTAFTNDATGGAVPAAVAQGASATPGTPALDPAQWATEDTLWVCSLAIDTSRTISVYPLASRNTADVSGGSTGATLGLCTTESAVSGITPGGWTISASDDYAAVSAAVRPGTAGAAAPSVAFQPRHGFVNFSDPGIL